MLTFPDGHTHDKALDSCHLLSSVNILRHRNLRDSTLLFSLGWKQIAVRVRSSVGLFESQKIVQHEVRRLHQQSCLLRGEKTLLTLQAALHKISTIKLTYTCILQLTK